MGLEALYLELVLLLLIENLFLEGKKKKVKNYDSDVWWTTCILLLMMYVLWVCRYNLILGEVVGCGLIYIFILYRQENRDLISLFYFKSCTGAAVGIGVASRLNGS